MAPAVVGEEGRLLVSPTQDLPAECRHVDAVGDADAPDMPSAMPMGLSGQRGRALLADARDRVEHRG